MVLKLLTTAVFAATLAIACSNNGNGNTSCTPSPKACPDGCNPCTKLSDALVAQTIGLPQVAGMWNGDVCEWDFMDASNTMFYVQLQTNTDYSTFQLQCHPKMSDAGIVVTPVTGVGDDACNVATGGSTYVLKFLKGCDAYGIAIRGVAAKPAPFPDATVQMYSKTLAAAAAQNL